MRIAWIGAGPTAGGGVGGVARILIRHLVDRSHQIDCYLAGDAVEVPELRENRRLRVFTASSWWDWGRWYSRTQFRAFVTGLAARGIAQRNLTTRLLAEHRRRPYDVVYQFSNIEMFGLQRHLAELPPIVVHPETHIAGELRCYKEEARLRRQCEPRWRSAAIRTMLEVRARRQQRDIRHAALVIAISESFRAHLVQDYGVEPERTVIVPNPVDLHAFPIDLHRPGPPVTIAFVGRISVRKGVEQLIELSHRLSNLGDGVCLEMIGGHTLWSDYRPLLDRLNTANSKVVGPVQTHEVARRLAMADVLIQPSTYEPFGLTVAEALATGTPVVVSDAVGAGDFVNGPAVEKFPTGDTEALEQCVRAMIERAQHDGLSLRRGARTQAEQAFAINRVVDSLEECLADLTACAPGT